MPWLSTLWGKRGEESHYLGGRKKETKLSTVQSTRGVILFIRSGSFSSAPLWLGTNCNGAPGSTVSFSFSKLVRYYFAQSRTGLLLW